MSGFTEQERAELEKIVCRAVSPMKKSIDGFHRTLFGEDGRGGMVKDVNRALEKAEEHEDILRGKDLDGGMIKKVDSISGQVKKIYWAGGGLVSGGVTLFWKAWDWFSRNPPPPPPHH